MIFFFQGKVKAEMGFSSLLVLVLLVFFHHLKKKGLFPLFEFSFMTEYMHCMTS